MSTDRAVAGQPDAATVDAAGRVLLGVSRLGSRMRAQRPRDDRVSLAMLGVLLRLAYRPAMTPGELAESANVQPQSMTRVLARLVDRGLVERRVNPDDARGVLISLNDRGRATLEADAAIRRGWLAAAMAAELTEAERDVLRVAGTLMNQLADWDGTPA
ncbi:MAG: MarR family transcriptional regulator [Actinocatenispora sp.]